MPVEVSMAGAPVLLPLALFLALLAALPAAASDPADMREAERLLRDSSWKRQLEGLDMLEALGPGSRAERLAIKAFDNDRWVVQIRAAEVASKVGRDSARKALVRLAIDGEVKDVRDAAVEALRRLDIARATARLIHLARTERKTKPKVRALEAVAKLIQPEHVKKVRPLTRNKDVYVQAAAVRALGTLAREPELREEIIETLDKILDLRKDVKFFLAYAGAVEALGAIDADEVRSRLVDELLMQPDGDPYIAERIGRAFKKMDDKAVAEAIKSGLARAKKPAQIRTLVALAARVRAGGTAPALVELLGHRDERVRSAVVRALGRLGVAESARESARAIEPLLEEKSEFVTTEVVTALARLRDHDALLALAPKVAAAKSFESRLQYVVELAKTRGSDAPAVEATIRVLAPFTKDKHWRVSTAAIVTLGTLGLAKDLPLVQPFATHRHWQLRAAAFEAFGRLRAIESVPLLIEGLGDKDPVVRGVCHANLQILLRKAYPADQEIWQEWWDGSKKGVSLVKLSRRSEEEVARDKETAERNARYERPVTRDEGIKILQNARILVVSGAWDKVEVVLDHLLIDHTLLRAQELKEAGLNPNQVELIN
jgi:HEAT repeat protein